MLEVGAVPEISRFFGIVIQMYADDHPRPHFHARYAGSEVVIGIREDAILAVEWAALHSDELAADWDLVRAGLPVTRIEPLR